jgi:glutaredoxin 3
VTEVVVYTLRACPFCSRALALLRSRGASPREVDVTTDPAQRRRVMGETGHPTFPQIFIGGEFVGGCDDLVALDRAGGLDKLLG